MLPQPDRLLVRNMIIGFQLSDYSIFVVQVPAGPTNILVGTLDLELSLMVTEPKVHDKLGSKAN